MGECIEREAVLRAVQGQRSPCRSPAQNRMLDCLKAAVIRIPAANVAPVVRCKNCTHYDLGVCLKIYSDGNAQKDSWQSRNPDDFCSYGAMMDGGDSDAKSV